MKKSIVLALMMAAAAAHGQTAGEQFAVRAKADIGLGAAYATDYSFAATEDKSSMQAFGVEFGWSCWQQGAHRVEIGLGLSICPVSLTVASPGVSYSYSAGPEADMDGNSYVRHTDLSAMEQKVGMTRLTVPVYAQYSYQFHPRWEVYGKVGLQAGFGGAPKVNSISGTATSWGVYPEYGNLTMDDEWLNDFGTRTLATSQCVAGSASVDFAILAGAGVTLQAYKPLYIRLGFNYAAGLTNAVKGNGLRVSDGSLTSVDAPMTYTVSGGLQCRPLTDALTKCRLGRLGLEFALELRF